MGGSSPIDELEWLNGNPGLQEMMERYPAAWEDVGRQVTTALQAGKIQELNGYTATATSTAAAWRARIHKSRNNPKVIEAALQHVIKSRMTLLLLDKCCLAAAAGKATGKARLTIINGLIVQKLLFSRQLHRKPVGLKTFNFCWRFVTQKKLLMPLVQSKGIYCFYSRQCIQRLAKRIGGRSCLEIAAGDGTLSRFLREAGVDVTATDDCSWKHVISYPNSVEALDAKSALQKYKPQVVLCSWPPPRNPFERHVFREPSVELYIMIGSRQRFLSGNWDAYAEQNTFGWRVDEELSRSIIPRELDSTVLVFEKKVG